MDLSKVSGRTMKILLSVSVVPLLVSSLPLLFQSLNQFSINKSYVFLFCNGLMVFIAKNSALPADDNPSSQFNDLVGPAPVDSQEHDMVADPTEQQEEEKTVILTESQEDDEAAETEEEEEEQEQEEEREEEERVITADSQEEDEVADSTAEKEWVDDTEIEDEVADTEKEEEAEEEEGSNAVWMTEEEENEVEELNKKCEDFIRKMKAEFCSERSLTYGYNSDVDHQTTMATVR